MATIDTGLLALLLFLFIGAAGLFLLGIDNIRAGLQSIAQASREAERVVWNRHPKVLFGYNNIVFSLLLLSILLVDLFPAPPTRYIFFVLIGLLLIASIWLVVRAILASLAMLRVLQTGQTRTTPPQPENKEG